MKLDQGVESEEGRRSAVGNPLDRLTGLLGSVPFAASVIGLVAVACVAGTVLPQGPDVARYLQKNPAAAGRTALFERLGLTHVFSAWWFIGLLCVLSASLCVCTFRRYTAARRLQGPARRRALGSVLTHISLLLILAGGVIRGTYGHRGVLEFREGEIRNYFVIDGARAALPFSVHLVKFEIEMYGLSKGEEGPGAQSSPGKLLLAWPEKNLRATLPVELNAEQWVLPDGEAAGGQGALRVNILHQVPDFIVDTATREVSSRSDQPHNPAIQVETVLGGRTNRTWLFALHPDFNMHSGDGHGDGQPPFELRYQFSVKPPAARGVKDYKSTLKVIEGGAVVREKTIEVNAPLSYKGYTFYQSGYDPRNPQWTSLLVVRDPGVPLVYAGFVLMMVGLTVVFYIYPGIGGRTPPVRSREEPS